MQNTSSKRVIDYELASMFMGTAKTSASVLDTPFTGGQQALFKKTTNLQRLRAHGHLAHMETSSKSLLPMPTRASMLKNSAFDADFSHVDTDTSDFTSTQRKILGPIGAGIDKTKSYTTAKMQATDVRFMAGRTRNSGLNEMKTADELLGK